MPPLASSHLLAACSLSSTALSTPPPHVIDVEVQQPQCSKQGSAGEQEQLQTERHEQRRGQQQGHGDEQSWLSKLRAVLSLSCCCLPCRSFLSGQWYRHFAVPSGCQEPLQYSRLCDKILLTGPTLIALFIVSIWPDHFHTIAASLVVSALTSLHVFVVGSVFNVYLNRIIPERLCELRRRSQQQQQAVAIKLSRSADQQPQQHEQQAVLGPSDGEIASRFLDGTIQFTYTYSAVTLPTESLRYDLLKTTLSFLVHAVVVSVPYLALTVKDFDHCTIALTVVSVSSLLLLAVASLCSFVPMMLWLRQLPFDELCSEVRHISAEFDGEMPLAQCICWVLNWQREHAYNNYCSMCGCHTMPQID